MLKIKAYDFEYPKELIAQKPAHPRDSARMLVFDRKTRTITHDVFRNLGRYIPKNSVLVLNDTKVIPARLELHTAHGGKVKMLFLRRKGKLVVGLINKRVREGERLTLTKKIFFTVVRCAGQQYFLLPSFPVRMMEAVFHKYGAIPIPPYIKKSPLTARELKNEYQTVFARHAGSVAAPTASLHFTKRLISNLKKQGIEVMYITLHVGLGTFASVTEEQIRKKILHKEEYSIASDVIRAIKKAKKEKRPVIAVGTTVLRALESSRMRPGKRSTELFIQEDFNFKIVDALITNFHVPQSSLLILVSSFAGRKNIRNLYQEAIEKQYQLFSFGDGMVIV